jgi:hypothetical protein
MDQIIRPDEAPAPIADHAKRHHSMRFQYRCFEMIILQPNHQMPDNNAAYMAKISVQQNLIEKSRYRIEISQLIEEKPIH